MTEVRIPYKTTTNGIQEKVYRVDCSQDEYQLILRLRQLQKGSPRMLIIEIGSRLYWRVAGRLEG